MVRRRHKVLVGLLFSAMVFSVFWQRQAADAQVTEVTGSAYGFFTSIGLFGGPANDIGPVPQVTLPPGGSADPITQTDPDGDSAVYGPATIVQTTAMTVSTEGTTGPDGSVTSSSSVEFNANQEEQFDPFNADNLLSTCTASEAEVTGSVTLTNASLVTSTDADGEPVDTIDLPANPAPNSTFGGTIDNVGDTFRAVFNEQIREGDTLTVNAVHFYFGQNAEGEPVPGAALGEAIIGQSVCGVTASGAGQPGGDSTTTTGASGGSDQVTTTTTGASGGSDQATTTTVAGSGSATTVAPSRPAPTTPAQPRFTG
jgi:hypothetical protein